MSKTRNNSGFVLILVLIVLAVAGTSLSLAARRSGRQALRASQAQQELQLAWGACSIRAAYLSQAERLLRQQELQSDRPAIQTRRQLSLGGLTFDLLLADEQAKANVNVLDRKNKTVGLARRLEVLQANMRYALHVDLRPAQVRAGDRAARLYSSLDQLFDYSKPSQLVDFEYGEPGIIRRVTCWGNGKINFKRAEPEVLREVMAGVLTDADVAALVKYRDETPDCMLTEAVAALKIPREKVSALLEAMTDMSLCHSLWMSVTGKTRKWHRLYVDESDGGAAESRIWTFCW